MKESKSVMKRKAIQEGKNYVNAPDLEQTEMTYFCTECEEHKAAIDKIFNHFINCNCATCVLKGNQCSKFMSVEDCHAKKRAWAYQKEEDIYKDIHAKFDAAGLEYECERCGRELHCREECYCIHLGKEGE